MTVKSQLTLNVGQQNEARFENFFGASNRKALGVLMQVLGDRAPFVFIHGGKETGKSHLIQSAYHQAQVGGRSCMNVAFNALEMLTPDILEGLERLELVCLDDVDKILGMEHWELALFNLYNQLLAQGGQLVVSARTAPGKLSCCLPDLKSRLQAGVAIPLVALTDEEKAEVLQRRALEMGMKLNHELIRYIMSRSERSMSALMNVLDVLDHSSLQEKRKLTIPFVKHTLRW